MVGQGGGSVSVCGPVAPVGGLGGLGGCLGGVFGASGRLRRGAAGQAMAQLVPLWCRPRLVSRARLIAAARSASQCRFFRVPL